MLPETFRSLTFGGALTAAAARDPGKTAMRYGTAKSSFAQLADRAGRLRDAAIARGVAKGEVVAIVSRNRTEFIEVVAGVPDAGAAVAMINPRLAVAKIRQTPEDRGARLLFSGYWHRPEETAKAVRDGWVSVGDMARRDAEGFLSIVDRKNDMVISGGVAFVVARDPALDPAAGTAFCAGRIAGYKIPKEMRLIEALPRNADGKVLETQLREISS